jgi:hypothetical protein
LISLALAGCGYVGDPLPPALKIPRPVDDLAVSQVGEYLDLAFSLPKETMEGLELNQVGRVELLISEDWPQPGRVVEVATGETKAKLPVADWVGKEVSIGLRTANSKGRFSPWSNVVRWKVEPAVAKPSAVAATATAAGVEITWQAPNQPGVEWRVYRFSSVGGVVDKERVELAKVSAQRFVDTGAEYGGTHRYTVEGALREARGELSDAAEIVPVDRFAPAAPQGLTALNGATAVQLSWERNLEPDVAFYRVYRGLGDAAPTLYEDKLTGATYADAKAKSGEKLRYAVTAVDRNNNESPRSSAVEIQVP